MNGKPVLINCPWHDDKHASLAVYQQNCFCFGCGKRLSTLEWIAEQAQLNIDSQFPEVVETASKYAGLSDIVLPVKYPKCPPLLTPMSEEIAIYAHNNLGDKRQWYYDRGLTDKTIDTELLGYLNNAFSIPVFDCLGFLMNMRYRRDDAVTKDDPKYWGTKGRNTTLIYNEKVLSEGCMTQHDNTLCITEGELDCLRLWQEGIAAVSFTNGVFGWKQSRLPIMLEFKYAKIIIICFDQDDAGKRSALQLKEVFGERARILQWDKKLGKDITILAQRKGVDYLKQLIEALKPPNSGIHALGR